MDVTSTKNKRGRPKGSKNKIKVVTNEKHISPEDSSEFSEEGQTKQLDVVSQMETFRNTILEKLKLELFGEGNNLALPIPPMNLSAIFATSATYNQGNTAEITCNSDRNFIETNNSSANDKAIMEKSNNKEDALKLAYKRRGHPKFSLSSNLSQNEVSDCFKPQSSTKSCASTSSHVVSQLPPTCAESPQPVSSVETTEHQVLKTSADTNKAENLIDSFTIDDFSKEFEDSKNGAKYNRSKSCGQPFNAEDLKVIKKKQKPHSNSNHEPISPKLEIIEEILQRLSLSSPSSFKVSDPKNDGSTLAQIFSKGVVKPTNPNDLFNSRIIFSKKLLSSFSTFCERRLSKKKLKVSNSNAISNKSVDFACVTNTNGFHSENVSNPREKNVYLSGKSHKKNVGKTLLGNTTGGALVKSMETRNTSRYSWKELSARDDFVNKDATRSTPLITMSENKQKQLISVESQTEDFQSHKECETQTETTCSTTKETSDFSLQVGTPSTMHVYVCSKCNNNTRSQENNPEDDRMPSDKALTPVVSVPSALAVGLLNTFNMSLNKFDALLNSSTICNKESAFNFPNSLLDSAFLNDLLAAGTPRMKDRLECDGLEPNVCTMEYSGPVTEEVNNPANIQSTTSTTSSTNSTITLVGNKKFADLSSKVSQFEITNQDVIIHNSLLEYLRHSSHGAKDRNGKMKKKQLEDEILRGNLPDMKKPSNFSNKTLLPVNDGILPNHGSLKSTLLDEGFINVSSGINLDSSHEEETGKTKDPHLNTSLQSACTEASSTSTNETSSSLRRKKRKRVEDMGYSETRRKRCRRNIETNLQTGKKTLRKLEIVSGNLQSKAEPSINDDDDDDDDDDDVIIVNKTLQQKRIKIKSPVYKKVRRCTYFDAKPVCKDYEPHSCNCKISLSDDPKETCCGESCLNRLVYTECHPSTCPAGEKCSNRSIQKRKWVEELIKFQTKDRGFGVKSLKSLVPGQLIIEYCGEVVSENEFRRRMSQEYCHERHHYCLNLDGGMVIDGYRAGNISRFINHSCQPNCVMEKWNVNGIYRMGLFAVGEIKKGAELTYDYNFHAYNSLSQQICKCGSRNCRGVMGGKNQRINKEIKCRPVIKKQVPRKLKPGYLKSFPSADKVKMPTAIPVSLPFSSLSLAVVSQFPSKIFSSKEKSFIQKQKLFLVRNVNKIKLRRLQRSHNNNNDSNKSRNKTPQCNKKLIKKESKKYGKFLMGLPGFNNMFNFTIRAPGQSELPFEKNRDHLKTIFTTIINTISDADGTNLAASNSSVKLLTLPRFPCFKPSVQEPSSLEAILSNVQLGHYKSLQAFNHNINQLFVLVQKQEFFNPDIEDAITNIKRVYKDAAKDALSLFDDIILKPLPSELPNPVNNNNNNEFRSFKEAEKVLPDKDAPNESNIDEEIEVIRCACNIYKDEGLMIQCDKCEKWQHCMCMNVRGDEDCYMCELCDLRPISKEVLLIPQPDDALAHCRYYMTLMRDEHLQVRVGDCVYVTREGSSIDIDAFRDGINATETKEQLDIFRVERLWRKYNGDGCAFGHYYMRPHETFHEANRKFYPNEVFRAPLYHVVPLEAIVGTCCVTDAVTYCKGHPIDIKPGDMYICEYRVDKSARLFSKINKSKHTINTFSYCFCGYPTKLKPKRNYMVHQTHHAQMTNNHP